MSTNTCDQCQHYIPPRWTSSHTSSLQGSCMLMADLDSDDQREDNITTGCICGDFNGTGFINVGPKFGCIHWAKKA